jgi:hypothetical protein
MAAVISDELSRPVAYRPVSVSDWARTTPNPTSFRSWCREVPAPAVGPRTAVFH